MTREAALTELRHHAKDYFNAVAGADTLLVFRYGKPIAEKAPVRCGIPSWKRQATPPTVKGLSHHRRQLPATRQAGLKLVKVA
ncbi:MAG: prevent-host-death protein [Proteobacteria bacterium]|nr:prevent-host-death protein [Pseudomonadota bacterium]